MVPRRMQFGRQGACHLSGRVPARSLSRRSRSSGRSLFRSLVPLFIILMLAGTPAATAQPATVATPAQVQVEPGNDALVPFVVRLADPDVLVVADKADELIAQARQRQADELAPVLADLVDRGLAGPYTFDEDRTTVRVPLSEAGRDELQGQPVVASIEPDEENGVQTASAAEGSAPRAPMVQTGVSSVIFAQVNTPLVWGNTAIGGLDVQLTLEDGSGQVKGVPAPMLDSTKTCKALEHCVNVDPSLYFDTIFVDPSDSKKYVSMRPGDVIHVITSGDDPATPGADPDQEKKVAVVDVAACSSPEQDRVQGTVRTTSGGTPLANWPVVVTFGTSLSLSSGYVTPGSGMTYSEQRTDAGGQFTAATFRTSSNSTYNKVDFVQGTRGFVRAQVLDSQRVPTGDEIYTVYGENAYIVMNSTAMHGYAYLLPGAPYYVVSGVAAPRPQTTVDITLKDSQGTVKASGSFVMGPVLPYKVRFLDSAIVGGDVVEITISHGGNVASVNAVRTVPISVLADLARNQVTGKGPANTGMVISAGNVDGYVTQSSTFNLMETRVNSAADGSFASGPVKCGSTNNLTLKPGSFGYVGYEGSCGNFVYTGFAAPINYVMSDFNFIDGWIADGLALPMISVTGPGGQPLQAPTQAKPQLLWLSRAQVYISTYYNAATSVYLDPGDVVTVVSGDRTHTIPVDRLEARLYAGKNLVAGVAPAGGALRVVVEKDRTARKELAADAGGGYAAANPYVAFNVSNCSETSRNLTLAYGDVGRVFLKHSDGNEVFATFYTRALHVLENEGTVNLTGVLMRGIDWPDILPLSSNRPVSVTYAPKPGLTGAGTGTGKFMRDIKGQVDNIHIYRDDSPSTETLIRAGGDIVATYDEGADWLKRPVSLELRSLALVTASPDTDANTLAGVGPVHWSGPDGGALAAFAPVDWSGTAYLKTPLSANVAIPYSGSTAYPAVQFMSGKTPIALKADYRGTVNFLDPLGNEVYMWWGVTGVAYQVKISGRLYEGNTKVCGTVKGPSGYPLDVTVNIHDMTNNPDDTIIGTGQADAQGQFCVSVSPALTQGEVVLAEVNGYRSQPVVVLGRPLFLPLLKR